MEVQTLGMKERTVGKFASVRVGKIKLCLGSFS
jgi:hypothetical protein